MKQNLKNKTKTASCSHPALEGRQVTFNTPAENPRWLHRKLFTVRIGVERLDGERKKEQSFAN